MHKYDIKFIRLKLLINNLIWFIIIYDSKINPMKNKDKK